MLFEIRKFCRLAAKSNPTLLELLFVHPDDHRVVTPAAERLLDARDAFLSRRVKDSFGRYALSQLKRVQTHRRWLLSPPKQKPTRAEFGLAEHPNTPRDQLGAAAHLAREGRLDASDNFLGELDRERRYKAARLSWGQYQQWLKCRNPKRAALEAQHGYDTKHALHLVRLMRMAIELLEDGRPQIRRPDREELLAIRDGAWSYPELLDRAEALQQRIEAAAETSTLPENPDVERIDALCVEIVEEVLRAGP